MLKIAITGSTGLIGSRITELLNNDFEFIPILQNEVDITQIDSVKKKLESINFDLLLHLAAYTNVDGAEKNKDLAFDINVNGTKNVFEITENLHKKMVHISTDFVFDGKNPPYDERSSPSPISYYGITKLEAEKIIKNKAMIVRLSYPYRSFFMPKNDFVNGIKNLLEKNKTIALVKDSIITPTFIDDIAFSLKFLFQNFTPDIFNIVGSDSLSPLDTGKLIAEKFNLGISLIQPISYQEYFKNKAKRPQFSEIKSIKNNFYKMKPFEAGLSEIKKQLNII